MGSAGTTCWIESTCGGGGGGGGSIYYTAAVPTTAATTMTITTPNALLYSVWREELQRLSWVTINEMTEQQSHPTDQELYQKAVEEHDTQEAERLRIQIARREQLEAERIQRNQQAERTRLEQEREREAARNRAQEFLLQHLTQEQQATLKKNGWFIVQGGRTKTKYRIRNNSIAGNIDVFDSKDKVTHRLCGHASHVIPIGDQLLAQKMMLESSEDDFLRIANRHHYC